MYNCYPDNQKHKLTIQKYPNAGHLIEPAYLPVCRASFHKMFGERMYIIVLQYIYESKFYTHLDTCISRSTLVCFKQHGVE